MSEPVKEKPKSVKPMNRVVSAVPVEVLAVEIEVADNSGMPIPSNIVAPSRKVRYYAFVVGDQVTIFDKLEPAKGIPQWALDGILAKVREDKVAATPDAVPGPQPGPQ